MYGLIEFLKKHWILIPLLLLIILMIGGLTYLTGTRGVSRDGIDQLDLPETTDEPEAIPTPIERFAGLDPAIVDYLNYGLPSYQAIPPDALGVDLQPIGAYLPRTGNTALEINPDVPTTVPTPLPYPTSPPLPLPYVDQTILPTVSAFTDEGIPRTVPYTVGDGASCAPEGNPVEGLLTQRFHTYHSGIDIGVPLGTPVYATHSGQVTFADWNEFGYGYLVIVQSGEFITYYAHNTSFNVSVGQLIGKNSIIAWSGSTGNSSGPHVHYETRIDDVPVDPLTFSRRELGTC